MEHESILRVGVFVGLFAVLACVEALRPRRARVAPRNRRWVTNWAVAVLDTVVVRLVFPIAAVGVALDAERSGWGLFNVLDWPAWLEITLAIILLDFAIWAQHWASHQVPFLWRLHRVHHADRDMDVTTAIRFHPGEILLSMALKIALVYALGPAAVAVILFEIILNGCAMFNHANFSLPPRVERVLRWVIVTPDMHRAHHSIERVEHDTNYGFCLSWWDRLSGLYTPEPEGGQTGVVLGLAAHQSDAPTRLGWTLSFPFRRE